MDGAIGKGFHCALIGVFAGNLVRERRVLWEELLSLKAAFGTPLFVYCSGQYSLIMTSLMKIFTFY